VRALGEVPEGVDLVQVAERVAYVGSPEHKDTPSFAGSPRPRADATICDRSFVGQQALLSERLREAVRRGGVGGRWEGGFPRYVWHKEGDTVYEARLVNQESGEYKGWALREDEWPAGIEKYDG